MLLLCVDLSSPLEVFLFPNLWCHLLPLTLHKLNIFSDSCLLEPNLPPGGGKVYSRYSSWNVVQTNLNYSQCTFSALTYITRIKDTCLMLEKGRPALCLQISFSLLSFYSDPSAEDRKDGEKIRGMEGWMLEGGDKGADRKDRPLIFLKRQST